MTKYLWLRLAEAKEHLAPVQSKYRVLFEDPDQPDAPASILVPDPNWMAAALHGGILPPVEAYSQVVYGCWLHSQGNILDRVKYSYAQTKIKLLEAVDRDLFGECEPSTKSSKLKKAYAEVEKWKQNLKQKSEPLAIFKGIHEEKKAAEWVQQNGGSKVAFYQVLDGSPLHDSLPVSAMTEEESVEYLIKKDIPPRVWRDYNGNRRILRIVPVETVPTDRSFRNAWKINQNTPEMEMVA